MKAQRTADRHGWTPFVSNQVHYSLQTRDIENEIVPVAVDQGIGIQVWSPIVGGLLSGKYRRRVEAPAGSRHLGDWNEPPVYDQEKLYDIVEELVAIADGYGVSAAQIALAYTLAKPAVTSLIVGARSEEQPTANLAAAELTLTDAELERLDTVSAQPLPYPFSITTTTTTNRPHRDQRSAAALTERRRLAGGHDGRAGSPSAGVQERIGPQRRQVCRAAGCGRFDWLPTGVAWARRPGCGAMPQAGPAVERPGSAAPQCAGPPSKLRGAGASQATALRPALDLGVPAALGRVVTRQADGLPSQGARRRPRHRLVAGRPSTMWARMTGRLR